MRRAAAIGASPNRITLLRDADGDGVAEMRETFLDGLNQPFGMALVGDTFYVGNTDGVVAFPYAAGRDPHHRAGPRARRVQARRALDAQPARRAPTARRLYAGVGSLSNIGEHGMAVEEGRAAIYELDLATGAARIFASGLRNPVGLAWEPDDRRALDRGQRARRPRRRDPARLPDLGARTAASTAGPTATGARPSTTGCRRTRPWSPRALTPDYALGGHTASLGLCWLPAGTLPGFPDGMAIGQHGSWNRSTLSGYKVIFVPFANGRPAGPPRDILTGFLSRRTRRSPTAARSGVTIGPDGALLVADDVGDVIWRVTGAADAVRPANGPSIPTLPKSPD